MLPSLLFGLTFGFSIQYCCAQRQQQPSSSKKVRKRSSEYSDTVAEPPHPPEEKKPPEVPAQREQEKAPPINKPPEQPRKITSKDNKQSSKKKKNSVLTARVKTPRTTKTVKTLNDGSTTDEEENTIKDAPSLPNVCDGLNSDEMVSVATLKNQTLAKGHLQPQKASAESQIKTAGEGDVKREDRTPDSEDADKPGNLATPRTPRTPMKKECNRKPGTSAIKKSKASKVKPRGSFN